MSQAVSMSTTSRRNAVRQFGAAMIAGLAAPIAVKAVAGPANPDAKLIDLCNRMLANRGEEDRIFDIRNTIEIEHQTDHLLDNLSIERDKLYDAICELPLPTSAAGVASFAKVSLSLAPREADGEIRFEGESEWFAWTICEVLAGGGVVA